MNEELRENGLTSEENENKDYVFSWRKFCSWLTLVLSVTIPVAAIGLSLMVLSSTTEDEKLEASIICYTAMAIGAFFLLNDFVLQIFALY